MIIYTERDSAAWKDLLVQTEQSLWLSEKEKMKVWDVSTICIYKVCVCACAHAHLYLLMYSYSKVSQPQPCWHLGPENSLLWGAVLCIVKTPERSVVTHPSVVTPKMSPDIAICPVGWKSPPSWEPLAQNISGRIYQKAVTAAFSEDEN